MKKKLFRALLFILIVFIAGELIGRYMGLNRLPLYQYDNNFEYIPQPNQHTLVYGHKYVTNEFSMRSNPILSEDTCAVLLIGDSIIYGGNSIDQDSLASSLLEKMLAANLKRRIRVLNISAQSWGPDNGAAYIKKFGTFHAKLIVLVNSSHDAHDNMTFKTVLGHDPYYTTRHFFAWQAMLEKAWPVIKNMVSPKKTIEDLLIAKEPAFNTGFHFFDSLSVASKIGLIDYLHSSRRELTGKRYEDGGSEIINFCAQHHIPLLPGIETERPDLYIDNLHFSNRGQKFLASTLYPVIAKAFQ